MTACLCMACCTEAPHSHRITLASLVQHVMRCSQSISTPQCNLGGNSAVQSCWELRIAVKEAFVVLQSFLPSALDSTYHVPAQSQSALAGRCSNTTNVLAVVRTKRAGESSLCRHGNPEQPHGSFPSGTLYIIPCFVSAMQEFQTISLHVS